AVHVDVLLLIEPEDHAVDERGATLADLDAFDREDPALLERPQEGPGLALDLEDEPAPLDVDRRRVRVEPVSPEVERVARELPGIVERAHLPVAEREPAGLRRVLAVVDDEDLVDALDVG